VCKKRKRREKRKEKKERKSDKMIYDLSILFGFPPPLLLIGLHFLLLPD